MPLANMQYQINGLTFGRGTEYLVDKVTFSEPSRETADAPQPREDSNRVGREWIRGRSIVFDIVMNKKGGTESENLTALELFKLAWSGDDVRKQPDLVTPLSMNRFGRITRAYGRPRRFLYTGGYVSKGWTYITAEFATVDHLFYEDTESSNAVLIVPADTGGILFPLAFPMSTAGVGEKSGEIVVGGTKPTWLVTTIDGPITNPVVDVLGLWQAKLLTTIADGQSVTIDPRPWSRGILRDGVANVAGTMTSDSPRMGEMVVPPGDQQVVMRGTDVTGTASMTNRWRGAYDIT